MSKGIISAGAVPPLASMAFSKLPLLVVLLMLAPLGIAAAALFPAGGR